MELQQQGQGARQAEWDRLQQRQITIQHPRSSSAVASPVCRALCYKEHSCGVVPHTFPKAGRQLTLPELTHSEKEHLWLFQASKSRMGITYRPPFAKVLHYSRDVSPENLKLQEVK